MALHPDAPRCVAVGSGFEPRCVALCRAVCCVLCAAWPQVLCEAGAPHIKIICKIESQAGLINYDDILAVADGIMVARGDLAMVSEQG
jgi:2-keto-3-deoxy-L-rhamnonate aldolase RhmA